MLVTPARTYWKKGRGPIERVDNATGEIMCLIEEPAVYKDVTKQGAEDGGRVDPRDRGIPAEYKTVRKRQVVKTAGVDARPIDDPGAVRDRARASGEDARRVKCGRKSPPSTAP